MKSTPSLFRIAPVVELLLPALFLLPGGEGALAAADKRPMTAHDLWACKRLGAPALSPDGRSVVFTVQEWSVEKNKSTANLWVVPAAGGAPRRLTTAQASDAAPAWSPDGKRIAFVSKRGDDENNALYVIPVDGGEAEEILEMPFPISAPRWMPDGTTIIVGTSVIPELAGRLGRTNLAAMKKEAKRRKDSKMTAKMTEDRQFRYFDRYLTDRLASRLVRVDVTSKDLTDLTPDFERWFQVDGTVTYDLAPDGKHLVLVMNSTPPPYRDFLNTDLFLIPTDGSGTRRSLNRRIRAGMAVPGSRRMGSRFIICGQKRPITTANLPGFGATTWRRARTSP